MNILRDVQRFVRDNSKAVLESKQKHFLLYGLTSVRDAFRLRDLLNNVFGVTIIVEVTRIGGEIQLSVEENLNFKMGAAAPSAEGHFYKNPEKREVREFAESGAISNSPQVAGQAAKKENLDLPRKQTITDAKNAPLTPKEIVRKPGGKALSTLNRFVVDSEDPKGAKAVPMNEPLMPKEAFTINHWLKELRDADL